jgi:hypothetical protein
MIKTLKNESLKTLMLVLFFSSSIVFAQNAPNEKLVQYKRSTGTTANACYDYLVYVFGIYDLAEARPQDRWVVDRLIGIPRKDWDRGTVRGMVRLGLVTNSDVDNAKVIGFPAVTASMTKTGSLDAVAQSM